MRLMHFIHTPRHSGAEMLVFNLSKLHRQWGHECAVASFAPPQAEFQPQIDELSRIRVELYFPNQEKTHLSRITHFRDAIKRFRPDVVFGHSEMPSLYGRFSASLGKHRIPFATVLHAASQNDFSSRLSIWAERLTRYRVNHVVAVSELGQTNYQNKFGKTIPVTVIKNGVDLSRFTSSDRKVSRQVLGMDENTKLVMQVGRLSDVKQQMLSLIAMRPLLEQGNTKLWFAGLTEDPAYETALQHRINSLNLTNCVCLLGSRSDIPELLAAADVYLMPSKREAHSVAMLEALASGVPIVASDISAFSFAKSYPSVAICKTDNDQEWTDAINMMLKAPRVDRNLDEYSIERTARNYITLFDNETHRQ